MFKFRIETKDNARFCTMNFWILLILSIYATQVTSYCGDAIKGCSDCGDADLKCTSCPYAHILADDRSTCTACPPKCGTCSKGDDGELQCDSCLDLDGQAIYYTYYGSKKMCVNCPSNCRRCVLARDGLTVCVECLTGFTLSNLYCLECPDFCQECDVNEKGLAICRKCVEGYHLHPNDATLPCQACSGSCLVCDTNKKCTKCPSGYYLDQTTKTCKACLWKCDTCVVDVKYSNSETKCELTGCTTGWGPKTSDTCDPCPDNCRTCVYGKCNDCYNGYGTVPLSNTEVICQDCPPNCEKCYYDDKSLTMKCEVCSNDTVSYVINPKKGLCEFCGDNCNSDCEWLSSYDYGTRFRMDDPHVISVNGPVCRNCKLGYGTSMTGLCTECPEGCNACFDIPTLPVAEDASHMSCIQETYNEASCIYKVTCGSDPFCLNPTFLLFDPRTHATDMRYKFTESDDNIFGGGGGGGTGGGGTGGGGTGGGGTGGGGTDGCPFSVSTFFGGCTSTSLSSSSSSSHAPTPWGGRKKRGVGKRAIEDEWNLVADFSEWKNGRCCKRRYGAVLAQLDSGEIQARCEKCADGHCVSCDSGDDLLDPGPSYCDVCEDGYVARDGNCVECSRSNCLQCDVVDETKCNLCNPFYTIDDHVVGAPVLYAGSTAECISCPKNCLPGAEYMALQVYYPDVDSRCDFNPTDPSQSVCSSTRYCKAGTSLTIDGQCQPCPNFCESCVFKQAVDGTVEPVCGKCAAQYAVNEKGECVDCPKKCQKCSWNSGRIRTDCIECNLGFVVHPTSGQCVDCPDGCDYCVLGTNDVTPECSRLHDCADGYVKVLHFSGNVYCSACPAFCSNCLYSYEKGGVKCVSALDCEEGYTLLPDGSCGPCPAYAERCHMDNTGILSVSSCQDGYFRNQQQCAKCPTGCLLCEEDQGTMVCTTCNEGSVYNRNTRLCQKCPDYCETCTLDANDNAVCTECYEHHWLKDGICQACSQIVARNCIRCTEPTDEDVSVCLESDAGYAVSYDGAESLTCRSLGTCETCEHKPACTNCQDGYTLTNEGQCALTCYMCVGDRPCGEELAPGIKMDRTQCMSGACWTNHHKNKITGLVTYSRGCMDDLVCNITTTSDLSKDIICRDINSDNQLMRICSQCCVGDLCNMVEATDGGTREQLSLLSIVILFVHVVNLL